MARQQLITEKGEVAISDPPFAHALFNTTRFAWLFVILRVYLGWAWLDAGLHKVGDVKWVGTGEALQGYWQRAVSIPETGRPPIAFDWYRSFIQFLLDTESYTWFAKLVVYGEILVGIALIVGAFVGIAAFFGAFMNWNFIMAGSASTNGLLFVIAVVLMLAWKVAGYYGLDYFLLRYLGVPWKVERPAQAPTATAAG
ncbi:MAG: DoxX family membrane protein [Chloroflexi bacterium OHK40]